jgi:hypothetical protein
MVLALYLFGIAAVTNFGLAGVLKLLEKLEADVAEEVHRGNEGKSRRAGMRPKALT